MSFAFTMSSMAVRFAASVTQFPAHPALLHSQGEPSQKSAMSLDIRNRDYQMRRLSVARTNSVQLEPIKHVYYCDGY